MNIYYPTLAKYTLIVDGTATTPKTYKHDKISAEMNFSLKRYQFSIHDI